LTGLRSLQEWRHSTTIWKAKANCQTASLTR